MGPSAVVPVAELVVGLDFGTANTKVVIMENGSENAWAVEFTDDAENHYLMPSRVYRRGGRYALVGTRQLPKLKATKHSSLKA